MKKSYRLDRNWKIAEYGTSNWLDVPSMPMGIHEILHYHKIIGDDFTIGLGEECKWVAEKDWIYKISFDSFPRCERLYLCFSKLDTVAQIKLNGEEIARSIDIYLPLRIEVTDKLKSHNTLEVYFQSPYTYLKQNPLPPEWEGKMMRNKMLRKPIHDFSNYLGAQPYLTLIGIFGEVVLEAVDYAEFTKVDVTTMLADGYKTGAVSIEVAASQANDLNARATLRGPEGYVVGYCDINVPENGVSAFGCIPVSFPRLWWPRGYGNQTLYSLDVTLLLNNKVIDRIEKHVGFREVKMTLGFDLHINNVKVRMWGSNLAPLDGKTHRWNSDRARMLLDMVEFANMNTLRIWGEGEPFDDELYTECDRRGILVWQEFFGAYGMQPNSEEFYSLCLQEAEYLVNRLKHHPCIFMWCGGNEGIMGCEYDHPNEIAIGMELYTILYPELCERIDPTRYYHPNSPYGGKWAGDPRVGDTHGYDMWWYVPGMDYPVAYSEHMRISGPALKSMRRWIPEEELWDKDFIDSTTVSKRAKDLVPSKWFERVANSLDIKAGPIHEFRDADSPSELAFKYSAAHAKSFKEGIKRSRMGRPSKSNISRISNLHLIWKLNDTWPLIYSAIVDYYLEPYIPFYEAKRSYSPVMVCFDICDSIHLWLINDSKVNVDGEIKYGIFNLKKNAFIYHQSVEASMPAGESGEIICLDDIGQFRTENILYAQFSGNNQKVEYTNFDYVDIDRRLVFPEAKINLVVNKDELLVSSDKFARIVELEGNNQGDEFGWLFEDNYFDLIPGIVKKVRIFGKHQQGIITARAHYSPHISKIKWNM